MITLDHLVNVLGGYGGKLACSPRGRHVALRSVAVHDPADPQGSAGDVLLAVGIGAVADAVAAAASSSAAAVAIRTADEPDPGVISGAESAGIAVLIVDPAIPWSQLAAVVYGLVLEGTETEAGRGPTDLFTLADALAAEVGDAVTMEDHLSRVLAYSSRQQGADRARLETILGRRVPEEVRGELAAHGVFEHLARSDEPRFVPPSAEHGRQGRTVIAVRAGRNLLGSIWVETTGPPSERDKAALADAARTAALHMLRLRASADLERQVESEGVLGLLDGQPDTLAALGRLSLPSDGAPDFRVIAVQAHAGGSTQTAALQAFERATLGFGWARHGRSALLGNTVYTVLPHSASTDVARAWIADLAGDLPPEVVTRAGIGGPAVAAQLPASRKEADESLAVHTTLATNAPAVAYDEAWELVLLERLRAVAAAGRTPERGPVVELLRHDKEQGSAFIPTLRAWLHAQGDLNAAAAELGVHRNTVRYRVRQMSELTDLGLDSPRRRLAMIIALAAITTAD